MAQEKNDKEIIFTGKVVRGAGRGKELGFSTANLDTADLVPGIGHGVYLVEAELEGIKYPGLMPFGLKETFGEGASIEVHIKGLNRDIYGQEIGVRVIKKIRDIKKFNNPEELKAQIARDVRENF